MIIKRTGRLAGSAVFGALLSMHLHANNIRISNAGLTEDIGEADHVNVRFDIGWENSWRTSSTPNNWDAAWVFVKFRSTAGGWQHARLHGDAGHAAPNGSIIATGLRTPGQPFDAATNWGVGAFLYRSADGTGTFTANGVKLRWDLESNGVVRDDIVEIKVFAVEMVYVPQGTFYVGSGGSESNRFKDGTTSAPFLITGENALAMANTNGQLWAVGGIQAATLPAAFPKGYAGSYVMKHLISQQDYVDFLNTLTRSQQNARTGTDLSDGVTNVSQRYVMASTTGVTYRNGIRCDAVIGAHAPIKFYCDLNGNGTGGEATDGQWIACNYLSWGDVAAYLDWSGLRPMTELEFEKAARGPLAPVANEYAWGSTVAAQAAGITSSGAINEGSTAGANAAYGNHGSVQGPIRVGAFASGSTTRQESGAGYYGALDLSGNLGDQTISVGNAEGRAFTGTHGNGMLTNSGDANENTWPDASATGTNMRGGTWIYMASLMRTSDRIFGALAVGTDRNDQFFAGGRGSRTAP
ncbi:MAG: hypothetical protein QM724_00425 [Flavobacteriales bacterium]